MMTVCLLLVLAPQRARDLGVPFEGVPGPLNAITDVAGVEVGHVTLIQGEGKNAIRTGVTAICPRGRESRDRVFAIPHDRLQQALRKYGRLEEK